MKKRELDQQTFEKLERLQYEFEYKTDILQMVSGQLLDLLNYTDNSSNIDVITYSNILNDYIDRMEENNNVFRQIIESLQ